MINLILFVNKTDWPWTEEILPFPSTVPNDFPWPKISIVTPSFNQAQYLEETIRSVLLQGYPNLEYIIIDGGSTDGSVEIIKKYEPWLTYWVSEADRGQTYAIQKGMQMVSGEILNWLNSDDYLLPGALIKIGQVYKEKSIKKAIFCGGSKTVDKNGNVISESFTQEVALQENILPQAPPITGGVQASWFITKEAWDNVNGLDTSLNYTMDMDLFYRCYESGCKFFTINETVAVYRKHENTKTLSGWKQSVSEKKRFYHKRLKEVPSKNYKFYRARIRKQLFGNYLSSISSSDNLYSRLYKVLLSIKEYPTVLLQPYQIKRLILIGFNEK